ncbi:MarR family winged helix-turn-helix transcriptional regulator [Actinomadura roseirufa]|uniref:MarR family winged helix-turn-helix transcriptional regulator n=1 Tax=Actinomadura roseirufa TaxID=2094049 RepID=UPI001F5FA384|nr:MarR family transcriptional regulator [Actinomadura roseirufa]
MVQYEILHWANERTGSRLCVTDLAELMIGSRSGLSYQVAQLEKAGLLRREPDPDDERRTEIAITGRGRNLLHKAAPGHVATVRAGTRRHRPRRADRRPRRSPDRRHHGHHQDPPAGHDASHSTPQTQTPLTASVPGVHQIIVIGPADGGTPPPAAPSGRLSPASTARRSGGGNAGRRARIRP